MSKSLYVATNMSSTGKRVVALGLMDLLFHRFENVSFFRPVVRTSGKHDASIALMKDRYSLKASADQMSGVSRDQAREFLSNDRIGDLIQTVQEKFKALESQSDFVIVEGTSFRGLAPELEFELNAEIAVNLGCRVLSLYALKSDSIERCIQSVCIGNESFEDHGCDLFATLINQVPVSMLDDLKLAFANAKLDPKAPVFMLPEEPLLRQPTIREFQHGMNAKLVSGNDKTLDIEASKTLVAAMQLPSFLEYLQPGSLVITPGDRSDIVAGCLLASKSTRSPSPAAIVLTGGFEIPSTIKSLMQDFNHIPILSTTDDTYTVASKALNVQAEIGPHAPRKIQSALAIFEQHIDVDQFADRLRAPSVQRMTPMLFEHSLIQRARSSRKKIVLPEGIEPRILKAADILRRRDVAELVLLGKPEEIVAAAAKVGVSLPETGIELIDPHTSPLTEKFANTYFDIRKHKGITIDAAFDRMRDVNYFGSMMVHLGIADGLVSGAMHTTANTIRPAFEFIKTRPGVGLVSSVFLMCLKDGVLVYGDCAIVPNPTASELAEIASSSANTSAQFGIEPRVAMLSYSTGVSGHGEDVEKVRLATEKLRQIRPDLAVEGPLQYDAAVDPDVAEKKMPGNTVAGRATVLIFPDLNTGNNLYKAVQRSSAAVAIGPVLQGLNKPVNDLSRGCTVADIVNTVAITAIQSQSGSFPENQSPTLVNS